MPDLERDELTSLNDKIDTLQVKLENAKLVVKQWTNASTQLARNAAEARAKTQGMGRGLGGALLGSKFRASMRSSAARENAAIAKQVADKRANISVGKMQAQEAVRRLQAELNLAKERQKSVKAIAKTQTKTKTSVIKSKIDSIALLEKLKEAYDLGLLNEQEYEQKRQKLISEL